MARAYWIPVVALRLVRERSVRSPLNVVRHSDDAAKVARAYLADRAVETLIALLLDGANNLNGIVTIAQGGLHGVAVSMRDALRPVLTHQASAFVLAHNHPSGDPTPSREDLAFTAEVARGASLVGVPLVDHVIIGRDTHRCIDCAPRDE
jgi:DNA repair protein RadC